MTTLFDQSKEDRRLEEASIWIARLDKGLTPEQRDDLRAWIADDPANRATLLDMAALWDKLDVISRLSGLFPTTERLRTRRRSLPLGIAASLLVILLAGLWTGWQKAPDGVTTAPVESTYRTAIGEHSTVTLADGTRLDLNTNSLISVRYDERQRLLTLSRGEVLIRVAPDPMRPLSVVAAGKVVQAVGTEFNIRITDDQQVELVVTEGKVRVGIHRAASAGAADPIVLPASSHTIPAGKELILGASGNEITDISAEDIEVKLSWRNGDLIFRGESLEEAVHEIGRYTSVEFVFLDDDLRKVRVAGLFKAGDVDGLLEALRTNFDITYERVDDRIILLDRHAPPISR